MSRRIEVPPTACPEPCGKIRFYSRRQARKEASRTRDRAHIRFYQHDGFWHMTSVDAETISKYRSNG